MPVTKLYNKILLREHPDASPVDDPTFEKAHSFIFPGDELVMCTDITGPADLGGSLFGLTLQSVKMSIIAKKPNIFSEEFSPQFASTRSFELDSVVIPFNNSNSPSVPWGGDGYAPNINFTQDRNWQLPLGDFRRQIKGFTTHVPSTATWKYSFWFPVIFREEYWNALLAADNDFYDPIQPQNGKNQKWLRYHDLSALPFGWLVKYRFELNYIHAGAQNTIVSEYSLSNEPTGIQDYESNPDYNLREIKTCQVGGIPSTSRFIFGSEDTSCFGYLSKLTPWEVGEKSTLAATFRLRPTEGGDRLGSRGSSLYPVTPEVVWKGMEVPIATDTLVDITTDTDNVLILDTGGSAVVISFDPGDDKNIILEAKIDYQKLAAIFPGVQDFTIYCRLYNGKILLTDHSCLDTDDGDNLMTDDNDRLCPD